MNHVDELINQAKSILKFAYIPYSKFAVGACIKSKSGKTYTGCNIENASYGVTLCAEASAVARMICDGDTEIAEVAVIADTPEPCAPCGMCRQRLMEFADENTMVHMSNLSGNTKSVKLSELLPDSFSKTHMKL